MSVKKDVAELNNQAIIFQNRINEQRRQIDCGARGHRLTYKGKGSVMWGDIDAFECIKCGAGFTVASDKLNDHEQALVDIVRQQETR